MLKAYKQFCLCHLLVNIDKPINHITNDWIYDFSASQSRQEADMKNKIITLYGGVQMYIIHCSYHESLISSVPVM